MEEKSWWQRIRRKKETKEKVDVLKDLQSIQETLEELPKESKVLLKQLRELEELEKERQVGRAGVAQVNIETQAELLDKILERYQFFQNDIDINSVRLRQVTGELLRHAEREGLRELVEEKKNDPTWKFDW